ncbi:Predicted dithiol-disulfide isomerase, DsbA family [Chitinophaga jiangningensis]|uniref:Predicted dithiol-disulfide isomerase, DsbA family n=1 Tax=Chitinophaga jiangningensis TaxID=1419482 RepID=A0A1M7K6T0_9BACT|nr:ClpXP adapter SpxH family protein [Chitinophaga jiangningensis]SHM60885.1 Predicted dithiol-disulfide isomerase, DsbA family [Chitinophaga jiangningensis]
MEGNKNPLICDPATGVCEMPGMQPAQTGNIQSTEEKPLTITYFTDPICSSCWGIEPQLRKLKLEFGKYIKFNYHMGGLLPDWSYNSGGISKPSDVAHHWDEVSIHYNMPIIGDVWLEDPLPSSYPPSIAFKAAQLQDEQKAIAFLRASREMLFLQKKNITRWEHLSDAAVTAGLDPARLKTDYEQTAEVLFQKDLELARSMGVRGFPSIFISDKNGQTEFVYGVKPYEVYIKAITKLLPAAVKGSYEKSWEALFGVFPSLTTREFAELSEITVEAAAAALGQLKQAGTLMQLNTRNGDLWQKLK